MVREQDEEIIKNREVVKLSEWKIKNFKALCQMILDQWTDIEQFFIEALEQVKHEKVP